MQGFNQQPGEKIEPQRKLMSSVFQGLFPPIHIDKVRPVPRVCLPSADQPSLVLQSALPSFRRVLLVSYDPTSRLISLRHYTISVRATGVSRRVRKVLGTTSSSTLR